MSIRVGAYTNRGITKKVNQDAFSFKVANTEKGQIVFAMVCDGMGGLEQGELASKEVIMSFDEWFCMELPVVVSNGVVFQDHLYRQWKLRIKQIEKKMRDYGQQNSIEMGTTMSGLLIIGNQYYICHVGDSRIYCIRDEVTLLTTDHTLVAQEVAMGNMTQERARRDARRHVLLQCVGTMNVSKPEFFSGRIEANTTFLICSDGFVHELSEREIKEAFLPEMLQKKEDVEEACKELTHLAIERGEKDNITVIGVVVV